MVKSKKIRRTMAIIIGMLMMLSTTISAFAVDTSKEVQQDEREYVIVNGEDIVFVGEDYENSETGEYIRWNNTRGVDKSFSFKVRYSVTSSKFTVHSSKVQVSAKAHVEDLDGNTESGYTGHLYTVSLVGIYTRNLQFAVGSSESGVISGLKEDGSYAVKISNNDYLTDQQYLVGSGTVSTL